MKNNILSVIDKYNMLRDVKTIIVGFSGGADSVCLLHFLNSIKKEYCVEVVASHINHNLRGDESKRDENFVRFFCEKYGIELKVLDVDIEKGAKENKQSTELYARNVRYNFFKSICNEYENSVIATAHTASDNAETVIYNIARGCSVNGICGIPPVRDNIIRPIIEFTREDVEKYCAQNNLQYVTDSTNLTDEYTRNKIRHNVIGVLKEINPTLEKSITKLSQNARQNQDFIKEQAQIVLEKAKIKNGAYKVDVIAQNNVEIINICIVILFNQNNIFDFTTKHINQTLKILKDSKGAVDLPNKKRAVAKQGVFRVINQQNNAEDWQENVNSTVSFTKYAKIVNIKIVNMVKFEQIVKNDKKVLKNAIDYDIICVDTLIRNRRSDDTFTIVNRNITKSVKKLFNEQKILQEDRDKTLLIANDNQVLWIENIGVSKLAKVHKNTKNVLLIEIKKDDKKIN